VQAPPARAPIAVVGGGLRCWPSLSRSVPCAPAVVCRGRLLLQAGRGTWRVARGTWRVARGACGLTDSTPCHTATPAVPRSALSFNFKGSEQ
jgi:hypothetical protein